MAKRQPTLGPRTDEATVKFYKELFGSTNAGAEFVVNAFPGWYRRTLAHCIKHRFTSADLMLFIDSYNSTMLSPDFSGQGVIGHVGEAIDYEHLDDKYSVDGQNLITELSLMDPFELAVLELWSKGYWEQEEGGKTMAEYAGELAKPADPA